MPHESLTSGRPLDRKLVWKDVLVTARGRPLGPESLLGQPERRLGQSGSRLGRPESLAGGWMVQECRKVTLSQLQLCVKLAGGWLAQK